MKTKISRLKKDINLLRKKLHQFREIIKINQINTANNYSFVQNSPTNPETNNNPQSPTIQGLVTES